MAVQERVYTNADAFWELSREFEDQPYELIEGVVYEMPPTGEEHGVVSLEVGALILMHVKANDLGRVTGAETGYVLHRRPNGRDTVLAPDAGFVSKARMTETPSQQFAELAPDLAVEVLSPSQTYTQMARKVQVYLRYGTRMVLILDPTEKVIFVHTPTGTTTLEIGDTLDGGDVLPGFQVEVKKLFGG